MTPEAFFDLFIEELKAMPELQSYYKFLGKQSSWHFRRNYFLERLRYIKKHIVDGNNKKELSIWDCGSGYGTTCLYLAMNGIKAHGTTLEFYFDVVQKRRDYWSKFGNTDLFSCSYEYLFDNHPAPATYDWILVQDTLHHLEPIEEALQIFEKSLKQDGKLLAIEENGNNIIQRLKLYKYRGSKLIIDIWDEKLQKKIPIGNENIKSLATWKYLFEKNGLTIQGENVQYIRYYFPVKYRGGDAEKILQAERELQSKSKIRREYFFFGINFIASKK